MCELKKPKNERVFYKKLEKTLKKVGVSFDELMEMYLKRVLYIDDYHEIPVQIEEIREEMKEAVEFDKKEEYSHKNTTIVI